MMARMFFGATWESIILNWKQKQQQFITPLGFPKQGMLTINNQNIGILYVLSLNKAVKKNKDTGTKFLHSLNLEA